MQCELIEIITLLCLENIESTSYSPESIWCDDACAGACSLTASVGGATLTEPQGFLCHAGYPCATEIKLHDKKQIDEITGQLLLSVS